MAGDLLRRVCTVVAAPTPGEAMYKALRSPTRCVELRLDYMRDPETASVKRLVEGLAGRGLTVIATIRSAEEGGMFEGGPEAKIRMYEDLIKAGVSYVDVEYIMVRDGLVGAEWLGRYGSRVIISVHELGGAARDFGSLAAGAMGLARRLGGIAKIAPILDDLQRLRDSVSLASEVVTVVGMGRYSLVSRVLSLLRGSKLTYGAHPEGPATAPGQPASDEIVEVFRMVKDNC